MDARQKNAWTAEEVETIRRLYPTNGAAGVAVVLTHRTEAAISLRASLNGIRIRRGAGPRDVTKAPRTHSQARPLEPIPDRAAAGLPVPPKPIILPAAEIVPGMLVNRYPVGTSARPAPRVVTQVSTTSAGARRFFSMAWEPVPRGESEKIEMPAAHWDLARMPDLAFEVYAPAVRN